MSLVTRTILSTGALAVVITLGMWGILLLKKHYLTSKDDENAEDVDRLYTTAKVEKMHKDGLIDEKQYKTLKEEVFEASKRRKERDRPGK